jgi:ATP synthase F1 complex assembly factor 1
VLQAHKENAPECLTVTHYTDLKEKGLVLLRGEYNKDVLVSMTAIGIDHRFKSLLAYAEVVKFY